MILGVDQAGREVTIELDRLVESRMLVQATSGGGKSWTLRRILEQSHARIQQIVIDVDGEFYTLRAHLDYVLAGKDGDCPAEPRSRTGRALRRAPSGAATCTAVRFARCAARE